MLLYSLYFDEGKAILQLNKAKEWNLSNSHETKLNKDGIVKCNTNYFLSKDKKILIEKAKNIKKEWIINAKMKIRRLQESMPRIRGFEKISKAQFENDFKGLDIKYEDIKLPKRATKWSAGYDVFSPVDIELHPGEEIKLPTGICAYMLPNEYLKGVPRSGQGFKYLRLANTEGIIDADYIFSENGGHFWVKLRNEGNEIIKIEKGTGMMQGIFQNYLLADGDSYEEGEKRNGGFGSTDQKKLD